MIGRDPLTGVMGPVGWQLTNGVLQGVGLHIRLAMGGESSLDYSMSLGFETKMVGCDPVALGVILLANVAMVCQALLGQVWEWWGCCWMVWGSWWV